MAFNRVDRLSLDHRIKSSLWGWQGTGTGSQRSCGCPIPGSVQGQVGWGGSEQSDLVEGTSAHGRGVRARWSWRSFPTQAILWFNDISMFNKVNANFRRNIQLMMSLGNCVFINTWSWQEGRIIFINGESIFVFFILLLHWGKTPTLFCFSFYMTVGLCTPVYNLVKCCAKLFLTLRKRLLDIILFLCLDVLNFVFWVNKQLF